MSIFGKCVAASESVRRHKSLLALAAVAAVILLESEGLAQQVPILGETFAHDPAPLVKEGNNYYYYSTGQGILARSSTDMSHWSDGPAIFTTLPPWTTRDVPGFSGTFWAPDVEYFNGLHHLYYAVSTFGSQVSAIGMATSPTLNPSDSNYAWTDHGPVIESKTGYAYNTIDPSVVTSPGGSMWMSFGSYWTGIYEEQLNPSTGMLLNPNSTPIHLAQRSGSDTSIEASYLYHRGGYYYLFTNWGSCCMGVASTYNVRVGRSTSVNGPFVDKSAIDMLNGGGTLFLSARGNYFGPGQVGIYSENGKDYVSYHYYNGANNGVAAYALQDLYWTSDNWPTTFQPLVWNAQTTGPAQDGSGSWDLTNTHFLYGTASQTWNNSGYGAVTFGSSAGPAGTVTLAQNVNVGGITFNPTSSGNYTIAGGSFSMNIATGFAITANVNATIQNSIVGAGDLIVSGSGNLLLSGNCSYTGSTVVTGNGNLTVNGQINGTSNLFLQQGTATIANGGAVTTAGFSSVGQMTGNNGALNVSGGLTVNGDLNIGDVSATGAMNISGAATVNAVTFYVGKFGTANGTVTQTGGTVNTLSGAGDWRIGGGGSTVDSAAVGLYQLYGGILNVGTNFQVGAYGIGTLKQTAGTANVNGYLAIGRFSGGVGLYDMSSGGGVLTASAQPYLIVGEQGTGTLRVGGSSTVNANAISLAHNGGTGTLTQTGGTVNAAGGIFFGTDNTGGTGTYRLDGGLLVVGSLVRVSGTSTLNFSGGTLRAAASNATFLQGLTAATVQTGGANIDTGAWTITIAQPLLHDSAAPPIDGGLTKIGAGTLTLTGSNTYSGGTTVSAGTLRFNIASGAPTIAAGATATVASGATLELSGSISALGTAGGNRVHIINNSPGAPGLAGVLVSGTHQQVGKIDGNGTTQVNAGSDLTANHIIQSALIIGGTANSAGLVTIDASDSNGNPLAQLSGFAVAGSLQPSGPFASGAPGSSSLDPPSAEGFSGDPIPADPSISVSGSASAVPEPSTLLLLGLGGLACLLHALRRLYRR